MTGRHRYRTAVIGCGRMGVTGSEVVRRYSPECWSPLSHAESICAHAGFELVALCDADTERLSSAMKRFAGVPGEQDYRRMLEEYTPEVVTVATRTRGRADIVQHLAASGVRGLHIEKPLCNSVAELRFIEEALSRFDVPCTYGTLRRYMPIYTRLRDIAWSGALGEVIQIHVRMGRAALLWTHPHSLDLLLFLAGDQAVQSVSAHFAPHRFVHDGPFIDCDPEVVYLCAVFSGGVTGVIAQQGGYDVDVTCERGRVVCEADGRRIRIHTSVADDPYWDHSRVEDPPPAASGGTAAALEQLVGSLDSDDPTRRAEGRRVMCVGQRLLLAACQSHLLGGTAVGLDDLDPDLTVTGRDGSRYA